MAQVTTGTGWVGTPQTPAPIETPEEREARRAAAGTGTPTPVQASPSGPGGAFGLTQQQVDQHAANTGANAGGTGYVSGQAMPNNGAMAALGAATGGASGQRGNGQPATSASPSGTGATAAPAQPASNAAVAGGTIQRTPGIGASNASVSHLPAAGAPPITTTQTTTSGLTSAAPGGVQTVSSPLSVSSPAANGQPGTSNTNTGTYTNPKLATTGNAGVDRALDPGGIFTGPTFTDTAPAVASQRAAFGLSDQVGQERYDYRPGEAASQGVVSLDTANADQIRARQLQALDALNAAANGTVPSAAELQMRQEAGRNVAATLGQARALGGRSAGGAARAGTMASADILARNSIEGAQLRASEQERARQAQVQALGGVRGQDVDTAGQDARLREEAYANNLRSQLEQNDLAEKHRQELLEAQLKALGIGTQASGSIMTAGAANANAQNKFNGGVLDTVGSAFS